MIDLLKHNDLLFKIDEKDHNKESLKKILSKHTEIKFVSLVGVDLLGNSTDERIPLSRFIDDIESFFKDGVQTDGSSVELRDIATLSDAKVTLIPDVKCTWLVDYNLKFKDEITCKPVGTLLIPAFLEHTNKKICSRSTLKRATKTLRNYVLNLINNNQKLKSELGIENKSLKDVIITSATELEFWVKTPQELSNEEELNTSQGLKEQYWKRAEGNIRTALEYILLLMEKYGFSPEMGHKEAGGVRSQLTENGDHSHIMEQLEIVWKHSDPISTSDNLQFIKNIISDVFNHFGLEVTFQAKPVENVAGSGEHMHIGLCGVLNDNSIVNIFNHKNFKNFYLSSIGLSSLAGILNNYEVINPFITSTTDAFNRLKPGFEAPVSVVCSLGKTVDVPSRNRTVLICLIKNFENKLQTRFELRSPNPSSNIYLSFAAVYQAMIDGMKFYLNKYKIEDILKDISKSNKDESEYFDNNRQYRAETDIFEHYSEFERYELFSKPPETVYENMEAFIKENKKKAVLKYDNVFTEEIINSYCASTVNYWALELKGRIIENYRKVIRNMIILHLNENISDLDVVNWAKIDEIKKEIMKDTTNKKSLFTKIIDEIEKQNYQKVSDLQIILTKKMNNLRFLYNTYKKNII